MGQESRAVEVMRKIANLSFNYVNTNKGGAMRKHKGKGVPLNGESLEVRTGVPLSLKNRLSWPHGEHLKGHLGATLSNKKSSLCILKKKEPWGSKTGWVISNFFSGLFKENR